MKYLISILALCFCKLQAQDAYTNIKAVRDIPALRLITGQAGDEVYVKYHTNIGDSGGGFFMWMDNEVLKDTLDYFGKDNNGTLIKANGSNAGRWVRQYDGYISAKWFAPSYSNSTPALQAAIDFAYHNNRVNSPTKGSTVFIPAGGYIVDSLLLRNGVAFLGDSHDKTILYAMLPEEGGSNSPYLFSIPAGPVQLSVSNLNIVGRDVEKGCFHFKSQPATEGLPHGGLWLSSFNNIKINGFAGNGIYLEGGSKGELLPNQFLLFELIDVHLSKKSGNDKSALKMTGQNGQVTFINTAFNGFNDNNRFHTGRVVEVKQEGGHISGVISFINASFQEGDYGVYVDYAENLKIDNCWFENLGVAITVNGIKNSCKGIAVANSRFANAAGYGSLDTAEQNIHIGSCIDIINSLVSVTDNYILVSQKNASSKDDYFIRAQGLSGRSNPGVLTSGNSFGFEELGKTSGLTPIISVNSGILDVKNNKMVFVSPSITDIVKIKSNLSSGEIIYISPSTAAIRFRNSNDIKLNGKRSVLLQSGEVAGFVKTDFNGIISYSLISISH